MNERSLKEVESFLATEGLCSVCDQWVALVPSQQKLVDHEVDGAPCANTGFGAKAFRYKIESADDAQKLAQVIAEDDGACLSNLHGHSLACGDGSRCHATRRKLAQALARFMLQPA
jgi:hypothetical protein